MSRTTIRCCAILFILLLGSVPASAQRGFEIFAGYLFSDADNVDDDPTIGLRYHLYRGSAVTWELGFSIANIGARSLDLGDIDDDLYLLDFSARGFPGEGPLSLFGGIGLVQTGSAISPDFVPGSPWADSFTAHFGLAVEIPVLRNSFLRPDARARFIEATEETVYEATLSFGVGRRR